jgi:hypothetical protein
MTNDAPPARRFLVDRNGSGGRSSSRREILGGRQGKSATALRSRSTSSNQARSASILRTRSVAARSFSRRAKGFETFADLLVDLADRSLQSVRLREVKL